MKFGTWENYNSETDGDTIVVIAENLPIRKKIRMKRTLENLSQSQLASILGLGFAYIISNIESGKAEPPLLYMERINQYLYEEEYENGKLVN